MNFTYAPSLTDPESRMLRYFEDQFERILKVPCGINDSVKWSARQSGEYGRVVELRTRIDNYLLHTFEAKELKQLNAETIDGEVSSSISIRWPKDKKFFDELYQPRETHYYIVYRTIDPVSNSDDSDVQQESEFIEFLEDLGAIQDDEANWLFVNELPENFVERYGEFAESRRQLIAAAIRWQTSNGNTMYRFIPLNPTGDNPLLNVLHNPVPPLSRLILELKKFLDEAAYKLHRKAMLDSRKSE